MKEKLLHERALVTCIAMLFICIILKLFGVQWFDLNTDIPILQEIDKVVMNSIPLSFLYSFIMLFINSYMVCLIVVKKNSNKLILCISLFTLFMILFKTFSKLDMVSFILDTILLLLICLYTSKTNVIKEYVITFIINIVYQLCSIFIKSISINISYTPLLIGFLFNLDYYIMLIITYLYIVKGGTSLCLEFRHFGSYLATKLWKKRSENYSNKGSK